MRNIYLQTVMNNFVEVCWVTPARYAGVVELVRRTRIKSRDPLEEGAVVPVTYKSGTYKARVVQPKPPKRPRLASGSSSDDDDDDEPLISLVRKAGAPSSPVPPVIQVPPGSPIAQAPPVIQVPPGSPIAQAPPVIQVPPGSPIAQAPPVIQVPPGSPIAQAPPVIQVPPSPPVIQVPPSSPIIQGPLSSSAPHSSPAACSTPEASFPPPSPSPPPQDGVDLSGLSALLSMPLGTSQLNPELCRRLSAIEARQDELLLVMNSLRVGLDVVANALADISQGRTAGPHREPSVLKSSEYFLTIGTERHSLEMQRNDYEGCFFRASNGQSLVLKLMSAVFSEKELSESNFNGGIVAKPGGGHVSKKSLMQDHRFQAILAQANKEWPGTTAPASMRQLRDSVNSKCRKTALKQRQSMD